VLKEVEGGGWAHSRRRPHGDTTYLRAQAEEGECAQQNMQLFVKVCVMLQA
jgi:hypothetical protein